MISILFTNIHSTHIHTMKPWYKIGVSGAETSEYTKNKMIYVADDRLTFHLNCPHLSIIVIEILTHERDKTRWTNGQHIPQSNINQSTHTHTLTHFWSIIEKSNAHFKSKYISTECMHKFQVIYFVSLINQTAANQQPKSKRINNETREKKEEQPHQVCMRTEAGQSESTRDRDTSNPSDQILSKISLLLVMRFVHYFIFVPFLFQINAYTAIHK